MRRPDFDAVVVGAGAGGAAAAYYLTLAGLRVLVVDRARLPRFKACGGAIPRPALERFPFSFEGVIHAAPASVRLAYPNLPPVEVPLPDQPVVMVRRSEFDAHLLAHSSAEVLEGTPVTGVTETRDSVLVRVGDDGQTFTARYLVGADGAASRVARSLGLRRHRQLGGALEAEVPVENAPARWSDHDSPALFLLGAVPGGYAWVFPQGDVLSVGIVRLAPGFVDLRTALEREMAQLHIRLHGAKLNGHPIPCYHVPPWPLWCIQRQERLTTRRCLLVGDAAGLVDPLIGEGIRYAMTSARLAAESIVQERVAGYEGAIWREIGHSLATAAMAAGVFYRWPGPCFRLTMCNPETVQMFANLLTERTSYRGIGRRLVAITARGVFTARKDDGHDPGAKLSGSGSSAAH